LGKKFNFTHAQKYPKSEGKNTEPYNMQQYNWKYTQNFQGRPVYLCSVHSQYRLLFKLNFCF